LILGRLAALAEFEQAHLPAPSSRFSLKYADQTCLPDATNAVQEHDDGAGSGDAADVSLTLEVGGDLLVSGKDGAETALPLSVAAKLAYREQILVWSGNPAKPARSLRQYSEAGATLKTQEKGVDRAGIAPWGACSLRPDPERWSAVHDRRQQKHNRARHRAP
jgi:hypothetical protein